MTQKIQPIEFSGRRKRVPKQQVSVGNVRSSTPNRISKAQSDVSWAEAVSKPSRPANVVMGMQSAQIDQASPAAARSLIPPTPRRCSFVLSVTTPLYSTAVS